MASRKKEAAKKAPDNAGSVLVVRSRDLIKSPPGLLGFSHLLTPDEAFGKSEFKANVHFTEPAIASLLEKINEGYWSLISDLMAQATEKKVEKKVKVLSKADLLATFREKFKDPKEGDLIQQPHLIFSCNSSYRDKDGNEQPITVKAFDNHGAPIDLKQARLGRESVVMAMFTLGVWCGSSPFSKWVALPTLRFTGLQVLKLKQFGGNGGQAAVGEVSAADLAFLDDSFSADDLSMFTKPAEGSKGKAKEATPEEDMDDEIPF